MLTRVEALAVLHVALKAGAGTCDYERVPLDGGTPTFVACLWHVGLTRAMLTGFEHVGSQNGRGHHASAFHGARRTHCSLCWASSLEKTTGPAAGP